MSEACGAAFRHERDPQCQYFEEMSKRCQRDAADGALRCHVLQKLMRKCPGRAVEEVERVERNGVEDAGAAGADAQLRGAPAFGAMRPPPGYPGGADAGPVPDPFDLMRRSLDQILEEEMRGLQQFFGGDLFGFGDGQQHEHHHQRGGFGSWARAPPHHRHRYGPSHEAEEEPSDYDRHRWRAYESEDV